MFMVFKLLGSVKPFVRFGPLGPVEPFASWFISGSLWFVEIHWDFYGEGGVCLLFVYYLPILHTPQGKDLLSVFLYLNSKLL